MVLNPVAFLMADVAFRPAVALLLKGPAYFPAIDTGMLADVAFRIAVVLLLNGAAYLPAIDTGMLADVE